MLASSKESEIAPQLAEPQCYPHQLSELLLEINLSKKGEQQWGKKCSSPQGKTEEETVVHTGRKT